MSVTVATSGCALFRFTDAVVLVDPGTDKVMEAGGHVERKPALDAEEELETDAATSVEPG